MTQEKNIWKVEQFDLFCIFFTPFALMVPVFFDNMD
jgi:hypothetical protein